MLEGVCMSQFRATAPTEGSVSKVWRKETSVSSRCPSERVVWWLVMDKNSSASKKPNHLC